jgi:hypothetical protein
MLRAAALITIAAAAVGAFLLLARAVRGRWPHFAGWAVFSAILLPVLVIVWVSDVARALALASVMGGGIVLLAISIWAQVSSTRETSIHKRDARGRAEPGGSELSPVEELPDDMEAAAMALEGMGFARVAAGSERSGALFIVLHREDGSVAEVARFPAPGPIVGPAVDVTSVFSHHRGFLSTSNQLTPAPDWNREIRQRFPGAPPSTVVQGHEEAARFLEAQGIHMERFDRPRTMDERAWGLRMMAMAATETSARDRAKRMTTARIRASIHIGRLQDHPELDSILAPLRSPESG